PSESPNGSQEFGFAGLSLENGDLMKRPQTGNNEPPLYRDQKNHQRQHKIASKHRGTKSTKNPYYPAICLQLDSHEISQEQLAAEVKSIYSRLFVVEAECIRVDSAQDAAFKKGENSLAD